ncbi:ABC transporter ATP-binding protein [Bowmanella denitrificans]|uniref:ABC transporter ATP-binding protein n=1 Tax=Bowmanella denitrificans TaxID=366582 RepID=UPI000C9CB8A1|nr:ABC transporter ATP-binding protein [Bowmanella denitrificans]
MADLRLDTVIHLDKVRFGWAQNPLLDIANWRVERGQKVFLYGPSGSGKSTLLNLLCGIIKPQSGSIRLLDTDITQMSAGKRDRFRAKHIGMIFQQFNLLPYLSVKENINLAWELGGTGQRNEGFLAHMLERLELGNELLIRRADSLSVGQQQRVAVARALLNKPELIIADEPTSALDSELRDQFLHLLLGCAEESQATVVFVSHDKSLKSYFDIHQDLRALSTMREDA